MEKISNKPKIGPTSMDKISQLPEPILHHILNLLEYKEATRTVILSKNWRTIFESRPVLSFTTSWYIREKLVEQNKFFIVRVDDSIQKLLLKKVIIHKFKLKINSYHTSPWDSHINRWMHQLVNEANVKELWLDISRVPYYTLPQIVFRSKTITSLRLVGCDLQYSHNVKLPNLLELSLGDSDSGQELIENLMFGCPSLEILELIACCRLLHICVSELVNLKKVVLRSNSDLNKVTIVAPKLQEFEFGNSFLNTKRYEINLSGCELTLKKLRYSEGNISKDVFDSLLSKFHELEELIVSSNQILDSIEIPSHRKLRALELMSCMKLGKVEIDAPDLQCLRYSNNKFWIVFFRSFMN